MDNIFYRIDDRLIHGQVITGWSRYYKLKRIIIADDQVTNDPIQRQIINMVAPKNIKVNILCINDSYNAITDKNQSKNNTLVLTKGPEALYKLSELGIKIEEVIIGGMQFKDGRKKVTRSVSVNYNEAEKFKQLYNKGIKLNIQLIPTDHKEQLIPLIEKVF
ncbi:PTS sugar transporter subunit IIB [Anaerosalibacter massiliensis]|uniref:PTS sugar transporter subunit IIB n=1 Tax=Anaerosalibacter massiliensis TaxID=1347392 RepID=A0A9X2MJT9_9FIRM|nr:PTS sugar transporter subunit IIB [Anaerosalibacter massiliensis]MCR2045348.1 PTS sugar transporter subunit IIB [Anaerosalibacter massiliensis]